MVAAQMVEEGELAEEAWSLLTWNLLGIAVYNIKTQDLFPEKSALEMKIKKLMQLDAVSRTLIDGVENGFFDALQKNYLKTLLFSIFEAINGPTTADYAFPFAYPDPESLTGNKKQGGTSNSTYAYNQLESSTCKMIRTLVQLMRTLDPMPEEPVDYEPPFFRECTQEQSCNQWTRDLLRMEVGYLDTSHSVLTLKVSSSQEDQYVVPVACFAFPDKDRQSCQEDRKVFEDETHNPEEDDHELRLVKDLVISNQFDALEVTDVLVLIEELEKLVGAASMSKVGKDKYAVNKPKELEYDFNVKDEVDGQVLPNTDKRVSGLGEDYMCIQYHALPDECAADSKLQSKLEGEANQSTVRKLPIDIMAGDGSLEATSNLDLGPYEKDMDAPGYNMYESWTQMPKEDADEKWDSTNPKDFNKQDPNYLKLKDRLDEEIPIERLVLMEPIGPRPVDGFPWQREGGWESMGFKEVGRLRRRDFGSGSMHLEQANKRLVESILTSTLLLSILHVQVAEPGATWYYDTRGRLLKRDDEGIRRIRIPNHELILAMTAIRVFVYPEFDEAKPKQALFDEKEGKPN